MLRLPFDANRKAVSVSPGTPFALEPDTLAFFNNLIFFKASSYGTTLPIATQNTPTGRIFLYGTPDRAVDLLHSQRGNSGYLSGIPEISPARRQPQPTG